MSKNFEATVAALQVLLLVLWEGIGALYFGWAPVAVALCWFAGIFTFNIGVATALRTYIKLTQVPPVDNVVNLHVAEDDGVA